MSGLNDLSQRDLERLLYIERVRGSILKGLFEQQRSLITHRSHLKLARCSRGAGKSVAAAHAIVLELLNAGFKDEVIYGAITQEKARDLIWPDLIRLIADHRLEEVLGWTVLANSISTPAGANFHVIGLKDEGNADKLRGFNIRLAVLDEVQSYDDVLENIISNVIRPRLMCTSGRGTIILLGTPGEVLSGTWWELSTGKRPVWKGFHWTMLDNPHYPDPRGTIDEVMREKGLTQEDPYIQREYFGEWAQDVAGLVHPRVQISELPRDWYIDDPEWVARELICTIGIDYGFDPDPSAWIVIAQRPGEERAYVVHAETRHRESDAGWVSVTRELWEHYSPARIVADYGGGGSSAIGLWNEKNASALGIVVEHAKKSSSPQFKRAQYDSMNDHFRIGKLIVASGRCQLLIDELNEFSWKDAHRRATTGPDHLCDALRYGWSVHTEPGPRETKSRSKDDPREMQRRANEIAARYNRMSENPGEWDWFDEDNEEQF